MSAEEQLGEYGNGVVTTPESSTMIVPVFTAGTVTARESGHLRGDYAG